MKKTMSLDELKNIIGKETSKEIIDGNLITKTLDEFFSDKVCIQILETRHEDADTLHQIVELGEGEWSHDKDGSWEHFEFSEIESYRVYEKEDISEFEYQWTIDGKVQSLEYLTEEEMDFRMHKLGYNGHYDVISSSKKRTCK